MRPGASRPIPQETEKFNRMVASALGEVRTALNKSNEYLRSLLQYNVQTLDATIYEHESVPLPPAVSFFTHTLQPQTRQTELITGIFASITVPTSSSAPTITVTNAWAQVGDVYINLNAILNSSGGTGGTLPGSLNIIIRSESKRKIAIKASKTFPSTAILSFCLYGIAIPATFDEVLT